MLYDKYYPTDPTAIVLPAFDADIANRLIKQAAVIFKWDTRFMKIDGLHNLRHASALEAFDTALEAARERGSWAGQDGPLRYAVRGRPEMGAALHASRVEIAAINEATLRSN